MVYKNFRTKSFKYIGLLNPFLQEYVRFCLRLCLS